MNRRKFTKTTMLAGATLAAPAIMGRASAAGETLYIADAGGSVSQIYKELFYTPFTEATGITVVPVVRAAQPLPQMQSMVDTKNYIFDACIGAGMDEAVRYLALDLVEKITLPKHLYDDLPVELRNLAGFVPDSISAYSTVYRTSATGKDLTCVADMWDKAIPGVRSLRNSGRDNIEWALRADGVKPGQAIINELKTDAGWIRAFKKLDQIKPRIAMWWTTAPQSAQLLHSGEIDITATYVNRAAELIVQGEDLKILWNQGYYTAYGWSIPKGNPKVAMVQKLIEFTLDPKRQAARAARVLNGTASISAYQYIDPKILYLIPTQPDNFKQLVPLDVSFWGENLSKSNEMFNAWLIK
ncbi:MULTISPECIES: extracellular solute-binding protein [Bradyrhizobium]|uniref:Dehydrogenase n=3 Tax=Bradyrhizobium TaxID=374 RepID=A0A410VJ01_9BRAD|nr:MULTISPECIES: extracellular solute-binding protein [Bradyrhizobium]MCG2629397.1 extracellular solute-binding protein [Bradyrhizobium zhengyangense]MCG2644678.1 extracellular solute-binding protein [Bradyrhizobium zhengyangense]MCG2670911.1 extracellular solute-binding protein [Bradyrhizobium zhengyangense]MDN4984544.1 extracellular solute-binding protein [Bradyrhizobium sp. WYCCWR 13022]MDN5002536.1 extracellular solute-binding protein [Bradyrhizobium sp. WYCCWR 12677]